MFGIHFILLRSLSYLQKSKNIWFLHFYALTETRFFYIFSLINQDPDENHEHHFTDIAK